MFLRNFYNMLVGGIMGIDRTDLTTFGDGHINRKKLDGSLTTNGYGDDMPKIPKIADVQGVYSGSDLVGYYARLVLGSGNTPVTYEDYTMASPITTVAGSNFVKGELTYNSNLNTWSRSLTCVLSNNGSSDVSVSEVGVASLTYNNHTYSLVYREVLSTPITIAAGESVTYTHKFEFTMPTIT